MNKITIVDKDNREIGIEDMHKAHKEGHIHRVVRVFVFNSKGQLFLQKRSLKMTNFPGLWCESVGGHVDEGEDNLTAAKRETKEEIGLEGVELSEFGTYYTETSIPDRELKRFNTLYTCTSDKPLSLDPGEVASGKWVTLDELDALIAEHPEKYTSGLIEALSYYRGNT